MNPAQTPWDLARPTDMANAAIRRYVDARARGEQPAVSYETLLAHWAEARRAEVSEAA